MTVRHFAMKLTTGGGPPPLLELERVARVADDDPNGETWVGSRKEGSKLRIGPESTALVFAIGPGRRVRLLSGRIVERAGSLPPDSLLSDMYEGEGFVAFWRLRDVSLRELGSLAEFPGRSGESGKSAIEAFCGSLSFAYWVIESDAVPQGETISSSLALAPRSTPIVAGAPSELPVTAIAPLGEIPPLGHSLYGVDFSGAAERVDRNSKIWIAALEHVAGGSWRLSLEQGPTRAELRHRIMRDRLSA